MKWLLLSYLGLMLLVPSTAHGKVKPIKAASVKSVNAQAQPEPLGLNDLEAMIGKVIGRDVLISCDTLGVPSPLDGNTLDPANDGQVFWTADGTLGKILHVSTATCWAAQTANRHRDPYPIIYWTWEGHRIDYSSGPAFLILVHEALHTLYNDLDEGGIECLAIKNVWSLIAQLNLPSWEAKLMLDGAKWRHSEFPSPYRTVC